jgi:hypothetical protein
MEFSPIFCCFISLGYKHSPLHRVPKHISLYKLTEIPLQWVPGAPSPGVKWPGREADSSTRTSAEAKNAWSYTYNLQMSSCRSASLNTGTNTRVYPKVSGLSR